MCQGWGTLHDGAWDVYWLTGIKNESLYFFYKTSKVEYELSKRMQNFEMEMVYIVVLSLARVDGSIAALGPWLG